MRGRRATGLVGALLIIAGCVPGGAPGVGESRAVGDPGRASVDATADTPAGGPSAAPDGTVRPAPPGPWSAPGAAELRRELARVVAEGPDGARVGVAVLAPDGAEVWTADADAVLRPASTAKSVVAAAALSVLGPTARFRTQVQAVGDLDTVTGRLDGHLRVVGDGDPVLATDDYRTYIYASRPATALEDLADAVVAAGISSASGGVRVAPDPFGEDPLAPGWKPSYLTDLDARPVTGLTVDAGLEVTVVTPPPDLELAFVAADDPPARVAVLFAERLSERGVAVPTRVLPVTTHETGEVVASVVSPPLVDLVRFAVERSDNHLADMLLRAVGREVGADGFVASGEAALAAVADLGVDVDGALLADGSGLSRLDRLSPRLLADVDRVMRAGTLAPVWADVGARAGSEGTMRRRLRGTAADGRVIGKTGTLSDVVTLVATVERPDGAPAFHVAVVHNVLRGVGQRSRARAVEDAVLTLLAEHAAGCTRSLDPEPTASPDGTGADAGPPPLLPGTVVCPDVP